MYGYPGYCCGYNNNSGIWGIFIVILIIFLLFWGNGNRCCCGNQNQCGCSRNN